MRSRNATCSPKTSKATPAAIPATAKEFADGREAILELMERLHAESTDIFSKLSDESLQEKCVNVGGMEIARWKWMRSMVEHEIHHRGQVYLYLGLLGVTTPPLYGLSSAEVRARGES
ncbi:MAG: DinB family protein [Candidatus Acidiferrum sp.]